MKRTLILLISMQAFSILAQQVNIDSSKQILVGMDLTQLTYFVSPHRTGLNIGLNGQYKLLKQLTATTAFYFNDVSNSRGHGYINMSDYKSRGYCLKLGVQTGVKLYSAPRSRHSLIVGLNYGKSSFRESGIMVTRSKYWGDYYVPFNTSAKEADCLEMTMGYEFVGVKRSFKVQFYTMYLADDNKGVIDDTVAVGYRTVFLPGYGYNKMGLNCIYSFNLASQ